MMALRVPEVPFIAPIPRVAVPPPAWVPTIDRYDRRAIVTLHQPLRPDYPTFAGRLWVALALDFPDQDLELEYVVFGAASGKPQSGKLAIPLRHQHEPWPVPELPTLLAPALNVSPRAGQKERHEERERQVTLARIKSEHEG